MCVCVGCLAVGGRFICMWLHASGCCHIYFFVYSKQIALVLSAIPEQQGRCLFDFVSKAALFYDMHESCHVI